MLTRKVTWKLWEILNNSLCCFTSVEAYAIGHSFWYFNQTYLDTTSEQLVNLQKSITEPYRNTPLRYALFIANLPENLTYKQRSTCMYCNISNCYRYVHFLVCFFKTKMQGRPERGVTIYITKKFVSYLINGIQNDTGLIRDEHERSVWNIRTGTLNFVSWQKYKAYWE